MQRDVSIQRAAPDPVPALVGLGSNVGDRAGNIIRALEMLDAVPGCLVADTSSLYETRPVNADGGDFLNAVALVLTDSAPLELLEILKTIERRLGRSGTSTDARPIDLDILFFGDTAYRLPGLTIPHPRWRTRQFVLVPLAEVCGGLLDPGTGASLSDSVRGLVGCDPDIRLAARSGWFRTGRGGGARGHVKNV